MIIKRLSALWAALVLVLAGAPECLADVPRSMVLGELIKVLELPMEKGKAFGDVDRDSPYAAALESALSMGILYPADDFSPEIAATNAETLMFALQAMGFRHEAEIAAWALPPEDDQLPGYIRGYVALSKALTPAAPASVTKTPWENTTPEQLQEVLRWASSCHSTVLWDHKIVRPEGTLRIHRENVGRPPSGWRVLLKVFEEEKDARLFAKQNAKRGKLDVIFVDCGYWVATPLEKDRRNAVNMLKRFKNIPEAAIVPAEGVSRALFWTSFTPASLADVKIVTARSLGSNMVKLSKIAAGAKALAAVNGGFFSGSRPIGTLIIDGLPVVLPYQNRSMAAWNDQAMQFAGGEFRARVSVGGSPLTPVLINEPVPYGRLGIFTPALGTALTRLGTNGTAYRIAGGKVADVRPAMGLRGTMAAGEWILVSRDGNFSAQVGDIAKLEYEWREDSVMAMTNAVQAGPLLFSPGRTFSEEGFGEGIIQYRHPRTLLGWDGKNMVWIVADGRSSWHSQGLTLSEAAWLGQSLKLKSLLNLDGGGSSELWWNGRVVNAVSDARERSLPYGLAAPVK